MVINEIVIATKNVKKAKEIVQILQDTNIKILTLDDYPDFPEVIEDGETFEANAIKKATAVATYTHKLALADDSGLEVYALNNQPGVHSARYAGAISTDEINNLKLLVNLKGYKGEERRARFVCVLALADENEVKKIFHGTVEGYIADSPRGDGGFGYDPLFIPLGYSKSFAELDSDTKNSLSHRGKALVEFKKYIAELLSK